MRLLYFHLALLAHRLPRCKPSPTACGLLAVSRFPARHRQCLQKCRIFIMLRRQSAEATGRAAPEGCDVFDRGCRGDNTNWYDVFLFRVTNFSHCVNFFFSILKFRETALLYIECSLIFAMNHLGRNWNHVEGY